MKFYLSGGMEYKKDLGKEWREWVTDRLEEMRHDAINPVRLEVLEEEGDQPVQVRLTHMKLDADLSGVRKTVRESLFRKDMFAIQLADAVVVLYDESAQHGAGTLSEAWEAFREARPVYLVTDFPLEKIPTWLIGETTDIFKDFDEFLDYVKDHSAIIRDIMKAQQVRDEVLGGIY